MTGFLFNLINAKSYMVFTIFHDFICFFPEFFLAGSTCLLLVFNSFLSSVQLFSVKKTFILRKTSFWSSLQILALTGLLLYNNPIFSNIAFYGCLTCDFTSIYAKLALIFSSFVVLFVSSFFLKRVGFNAFEYFILILLSCLAILLIVSSNDLISFYLALELQSLAFYNLASFKRNSAFSTEAGLKYFVIGAFSSGIFLFGCSLIYGSVGSTNYTVFKSLFFFNFLEGELSLNLFLGLVFILVGFLFKLGSAPFHMWIPDVYEGAPLPVTVVFSVVPKLALIISLSRIIFSCFYSLAYFWEYFFLFCSFFSLFMGAFGALAQRKIKRFLVFSSIGHIGFILLGFASGTLQGLQSVFFYSFIYILISFSVWALLLCFHSPLVKSQSFKYLDELEFLSKENPLLCFSFIFFIFSIAGIPPLAGFYAKIFVFFAAVESSLFFFSLVAISLSIIGAVYYLRLVKIASYSTALEQGSLQSKPSFYSELTKGQSFLISLCFFIILFFCISPGFLILITHRIALNFIC